ncbi:MAG TPA: type II toxin-antitoxin system HicA family toxin [Chloroflexota bacterium]|nr:type II toxin-antitoxin system HicA family toxin [Chloroflexota bacterium]
MPPLGPIARQALIRGLRQHGFEGPYSGTRHQFMIRGTLRLRIPNPHGGDISVALLSEILRQAGITRDEWERT